MFPASGLAATAVNSTAFEPGKTCGQSTRAAFPVKSTIAVGDPPAEGTRHRRAEEFSVAMILPSSPQLPPNRSVASQRMIGDPAAIGVFFSLPPAQNATHCPMGEK